MLWGILGLIVGFLIGYSVRPKSGMSVMRNYPHNSYAALEMPLNERVETADL